VVAGLVADASARPSRPRAHDPDRVSANQLPDQLQTVRCLGGQGSLPLASRCRLQRTQKYISKPAATSMTRTQQIGLTMMPSIAIPVFRSFKGRVASDAG
jgi:hypothetical protein